MGGVSEGQPVAKAKIGDQGVTVNGSHSSPRYSLGKSLIRRRIKQGYHWSGKPGKPGNVSSFRSSQGIVMGFTRKLENVREGSQSWKITKFFGTLAEMGV
jgi:hypothetical protein